MPDIAKLLAAVDDIRPHVDAWTRLLEKYIAMLPPDRPEDADDPGEADRSYAEHELRAMRRDLGALLAAVA